MRFRDEKPHPGIRMQAVGPIAGVGGLIFAGAVLSIFLAGIPLARWFLLASILGGLVAFGILALTRKSN